MQASKLVSTDNKQEKMKSISIRTENLSIVPIAVEHAAFVQELVNTEAWLRYIGERNLHTEAQAKDYIQSKIDDKTCQYWVVYELASDSPIGMITLIQRDYLPSPDLGFAFLPQYAGKNYAYESSSALLQELLSTGQYSQLLGITNPENSRSMKLLTRLGFAFTHMMMHDEESLNVYSIQKNN